VNLWGAALSITPQKRFLVVVELHNPEELRPNPAQP
jgi:hypothetical protein